MEIELSIVYELIDEFNGFKNDDISFYISRTFDRADKKLLDYYTAMLCSKLKNADIKKYSWKMKRWWILHKLNDTKAYDEIEAKKNHYEKLINEKLKKINYTLLQKQ